MSYREQREWGMDETAYKLPLNFRFLHDSEKAALFLDLQWFAAEDEGRTEEASEHKIRKAREEEGRVPKSQDLIGAMMLLFLGITMFLLAPSMLRTLVEMMRFFFQRVTELDPAQDRIVYESILNYFARLCLPIAGVALAAAIFSNLVQLGFRVLFVPKVIAPKFSNIVPDFARYFSKTLFSINGLFNLGKSLFKIGVIGVVAFIIISGNIERLASLQMMSLWASFTFIAGLAGRLLLIAALLLLVLAIPDYVFQRSQFLESLKMTKQEQKEEYKELEGDPAVKQRINQRMRELLTTNLREQVPKASVVITNPTHLSVAIQYDQNIAPAPLVCAKGEDETALRIREIAKEYDIPIVENKPVARFLYAEVEVGQMVPEEILETIAKILASVMKANERRKYAGER